MIARTIVLDRMVEQYLEKNANTIVINIACGLDTRCYRMKVNVTGAALFTDVSGKAFVSMVLVGSSSVFLFASVCVYACHKGAGGLFYAGLIAVWACVCVIARLAGTGVKMFLFTSVPLAEHGAVTAASFCLLFVSIGKVEKKDAYSFAC